MKICPRCRNEIKKNDKVCSLCGMPVCDMEKIENEQTNEIQAQEVETENENKQENKKLTKKEQKKAKENQEIDFEKALLDDENKIEKTDDIETIVRKRHKHKSKEQRGNFSVDKNGRFNVETKDVTFLETNEYSIKKARGDYKQEKLKWWEIYKWADRMLARRKVQKEVNKASRVKPDFISKSALLALCIFFGWFGAHNFYAKNNKKGFTMLALFAVMCIFIFVPGLEIVRTSIGGGAGFVVSFFWIYDLICICFNRYKFRISKNQFIGKLNVETRAKLGKKYIDLK